MTEERDPDIQNLFASADEELTPNQFVPVVMETVASHERWSKIIKLGLWLCGALIVWLLSAPIQSAVAFLSQGFSIAFYSPENALLAGLLLPVNNVATLVVLFLLTLGYFLRKIFT